MRTCKEFDRQERLAARERRISAQKEAAPASDSKPSDSTPQATSQTKPAPATSSVDYSVCESGKLCTSDNSCLSGEFCHTTTNKCMVLSCVRAKTKFDGREARDVVAAAQLLTEEMLAQEMTRQPERGALPAEKPGSASAESSSSATLDVSQAAKLCGLEDEIIVGWIRDKKLRALKIGDEYRISRIELARTWREMGGGELFAE